MSNAKSTRVPKGMQDLYTSMIALTDRFCGQHLNDEYADLARNAIAALCRKRPCPLMTGNQQTWACAVLYALAQVNFLSDKANKPNMPMANLCALFGIAASTGGNKAKVVRDALGIRQFDHRWTLPSRLGNSSAVWMVDFNGLVVDARRLPVEIQEAAVLKGLIPYVVPPANNGVP
jgi:hypothetical protein